MDFIQGHEKVTSIFRRWPSFHDGEVERLGLERDEQGMNVRLSYSGCGDGGVAATFHPPLFSG